MGPGREALGCWRAPVSSRAPRASRDSAVTGDFRAGTFSQQILHKSRPSLPAATPQVPRAPGLTGHPIRGEPSDPGGHTSLSTRGTSDAYPEATWALGGAGDQGEHGGLGAAGETGGGPGGGAEAGRDVQPGAVTVQRRGVGGGVLAQAADPGTVDGAVGDQGAVAGGAELAAVGVAREQDVVAVGGEVVHDPGLGSVHDAQPQVGRWIS